MALTQSVSDGWHPDKHAKRRTIAPFFRYSLTHAGLAHRFRALSQET